MTFKIPGLYQLCTIYKINNLKDYINHEIMRSIDLEARWEYDILRAIEGTGYVEKDTLQLISFSHFIIFYRPELGVVVRECGEFLIEATRMNVERVCTSLQRDPNMQKYTFSDIITKYESSIRRIYRLVCVSCWSLSFINFAKIRDLSHRHFYETNYYISLLQIHLVLV